MVPENIMFDTRLESRKTCPQPIRKPVGANPYRSTPHCTVHASLYATRTQHRSPMIHCEFVSYTSSSVSSPALYTNPPSRHPTPPDHTPTNSHLRPRTSRPHHSSAFNRDACTIASIPFFATKAFHNARISSSRSHCFTCPPPSK